MIIFSKKQNFKNDYSGGYTVLELVFYISFFVIFSLLAINSMIIMAKSFKETTIEAEWLQGASIMDRVTREARASLSINTITSSDLKLNTKDSSGANKTIEFLLAGSNLQLLENGVLTGNLNPPNIVITGVSFNEVDTTNSKAIKISLTIKSANDVAARNLDFYDTVVLRGSYQ